MKQGKVNAEEIAEKYGYSKGEAEGGNNMSKSGVSAQKRTKKPKSSFSNVTPEKKAPTKKDDEESEGMKKSTYNPRENNSTYHPSSSQKQ